MAANEGSSESKTNGGGRSRREPSVVIVDVANVAYGRQARGESAKLSNVNAVLSELGQTPIRVVAVADAALRHKIDQKDGFEKMIDDGRVDQAPAGTDADDFMWSLAERYRSKGRATYILTNDRFPIEKAKKAGMAHPDRITFMFVGDELLFQPPLPEIVWQDGEPPPPSPSADPVSDGPSRPAGLTDCEVGPNGNLAFPTPSFAFTLGRHESPAVPPELLDRLRRFFVSRVDLGTSSPEVNFATVAHFLHSWYGGNFTTRFGFRRPKDLALALESGGYVTISHRTTTLYIEPTAKLVESAPDEELV